MAGRTTIAGAAALTVVALIGAGIATAQATAAEGRRAAGAESGHDGRTAAAELQDTAGAAVGRLELSETDAGAVRVRLRATGQTPGFHGLHFHARALCEPVSSNDTGMTGAFLSAGPHYATEGQQHGHHAGDLPSLYVTADGRGTLEATVDASTVDELLAGDGSAVIIHSMPDNFANIPDRYTQAATGEPGPDAMTLATGDSGSRVACGVLAAGGS